MSVTEHLKNTTNWDAYPFDKSMIERYKEKDEMFDHYKNEPLQRRSKVVTNYFFAVTKG